MDERVCTALESIAVSLLVLAVVQLSIHDDVELVDDLDTAFYLTRPLPIDA